MSCRDWARVLEHRFDATAAPPADWDETLAHLDECPDCRAEATAIDPLLAFAGAASWESGPNDSEAMRRAVDAVLRSERLSRRSSGSGPRRNRVAAAALFAATVLLIPATTGREERTDSWPSRTMTGSAAPAIDGIDRPLARVYEWGGEDLSVVMVVDESLDV